MVMKPAKQRYQDYLRPCSLVIPQHYACTNYVEQNVPIGKFRVH